MGNPYLVFPHGMLDPWFKKTYPFKHLKKQFYWWARQGAILRGARAVCFTTEEERLLAQNTFFPYHANEVVTGLGVGDPPVHNAEQTEQFYQKFPRLKDRRLLLYLGRFHPKKGVDDLIRAWKNRKQKGDEVLVLAGPLEEKEPMAQNPEVSGRRGLVNFLDRHAGRRGKVGGSPISGCDDPSIPSGKLRDGGG